jgi:streptogramin lyase
MLRRFSKEGIQELEIFSREKYPKWPHPAVGAGLAVAGSSLILFLPSSGELIEFSAATGAELKRQTFPQPNAFALRGMAVKSDGTVYFSGSRADKTAKTSLPVHARLDRAEGRWIDVSNSMNSDPHSPLFLVGGDGDQIVLGSNKFGQLQWFHEP